MLPSRYQAWLTQVLAGPLPREHTATCDRCSMLGATAPEGYGFAAHSKCCTYIPVLPNFLVGAALRDLPRGPGRTSLEHRLADADHCTPHGLAVSPTAQAAYAEILATERFGQASELRCPHYIDRDGGQCGIWDHRNGICATWFCKHDRGRTGQAFWQAVEALLTLVELELCHWSACQVLEDVPPPGQPDPTAELPAWSAWTGHHAAYYGRTMARVDALTWPEIAAIVGPALTSAIHDVQVTYATLTAAEPLVSLRVPPRVLVPGTLRISHVGPTHARLVTYLDSDPIELPRELLQALGHFDGRPTARVLGELAAIGIDLSHALLAQLVDLAILIPKPPPAADR